MKTLKDTISKILLFLIQIIESYEYRNMDLDEGNISKKIIETINLENYEVLTDTGYSPVNMIHKTQPYTVWKISTNTKYIECADNHIIFDENMNELFVKETTIGQLIQTKNGLERIINIEKYNIKTSMFDITVADKNHRYYTNGILSHNTVMSGIYLTWYLCFHYDRNILVVANKAATMMEIVDKVKTVYKNLPFFLKPGVTVNNMSSMHFDNGCRIIGQATSASPALGFTIHLLYADEFAHIPENIVRPFFRSIYPTLSSSNISKMIITSTANEMNKFHEIYERATKKENKFTPLRVDWWQVPGRDEEWKKQEISNMGLEDFNKEYGNQFMQGDRMLFSAKIKELWKKRKTEYEHKEILAFERKNLKYNELVWHKDYDINYGKNDKFIISIDIAEGKGKDYTVANIFKLEVYSDEEISKTENFKNEIDFIRLKQIGIFRSNKLSVIDFSEILKTLAFDYFNSENIKIAYEVNFQGSILNSNLSTHVKFYKNIFLKTKHSQKARTLSEGINYNKQNKPLMCNELLHYVTTEKIYIDEDNTITECNNFGLNKKGLFSAQVGNDDIVMSCVNLVAYLQNKTFTRMAGEYHDSLPDDIKNKIIKKLTSIDIDDNESFNFNILKDFI